MALGRLRSNDGVPAMFRLGVQFLRLLIGGVFCLAGVACSSLSPVRETASGSPGGMYNPAREDLQVQIEWTYQDQSRFAMEVSIKHYPVPRGFRLRCPLTQLEIQSADNNLLLYRNPDQIELNEFYALTQNNYWYCSKQAEGDGFADYLFSLSHFYQAGLAPKLNGPLSLSLELGEVRATNSVSTITLPAAGAYNIPLQFQPAAKNLTRFPSSEIEDQAVAVQIQKITVNPSVTWLDACLETQDHHLWRPTAELIYDSQEAYSTEWLPTYPFPFDRNTTLQSTHRCYSFTIPFAFPLGSASSFRAGINQVQIDNTDSGLVTMQDCESVKQTMEVLHPGLKIHCIEFKLRGEQQHWFEVISRPSDMSAEDAYTLVKSAFIRTIVGSWFVEISLK